MEFILIHVVLPLAVTLVVGIFLILKKDVVKYIATKIKNWWYDLFTTKSSAQKKYNKLMQEEYWKVYAASPNLISDNLTALNQNTINNFKAQAQTALLLTEKERRLLGLIQ